MYQDFFPAVFLRVGQKLPKPVPTLRIDHFVTDVRYTEDEKIYVRTSAGLEIFLSPLENLTFPRRPDGSTRTYDEPVHISKLVPGDRIVTDAGLYEIVMSVALDPRQRAGFFSIRTMDTTGQVRRYIAHESQPFTLPNERALVPPAQPNGHRRYGPYRNTITNTEPFYFLTHTSPQGGRWPAGIDVFDLNESPPGTYRTFTRRGLWYNLELLPGGTRHPHDPNTAEETTDDHLPEG